MHTLLMAAATLLAASPALAQTPAQPAPLPDVAPQFVVTYIEVAPKAADAAAGLARAYRDAARKDDGVVLFEIFQRLHAPHHFALVAQWKDTKTFMAHGEAAHTPGNMRYDALTQSTRPNHMTLVEVWRDQAAYDAHLVTAHMKTFRAGRLPQGHSVGWVERP